MTTFKTGEVQVRAGRGSFVRPPSKFRDWVSNDRSTAYPAEAGRYHLYLARSCPWAHRTLIGRRLKGLEDVITVKHTYETFNNAVYRGGFASSQEPYEDAVTGIFATLDELDERLEDRRYLLGDMPVKTDWRLFTTMVRFESIYYIHFNSVNPRGIVALQPEVVDFTIPHGRHNL